MTTLNRALDVLVSGAGSSDLAITGACFPDKHTYGTNRAAYLAFTIQRPFTSQESLDDAMRAQACAHTWADAKAFIAETFPALVLQCGATCQLSRVPSEAKLVLRLVVYTPGLTAADSVRIAEHLDARCLELLTDDSPLVFTLDGARRSVFRPDDRVDDDGDDMPPAKPAAGSSNDVAAHMAAVDPAFTPPALTCDEHLRTAGTNRWVL
jgi:hypothetical protein